MPASWSLGAPLHRRKGRRRCRSPRPGSSISTTHRVEWPWPRRWRRRWTVPGRPSRSATARATCMRSTSHPHRRRRPPPLGWVTRDRGHLGTGPGLRDQSNDGGIATPATGVIGAGHPRQPSDRLDGVGPRTTAALDQLTFGAGNAFESRPGRVLRAGRQRRPCKWNQVVQNPRGSNAGVGVQASPSIGQVAGVPLRQCRIAGSGDLFPQRRHRIAIPGLAGIHRRQRVLHRRGGRPVRHRTRRYRRWRRLDRRCCLWHPLSERGARPNPQRSWRPDLRSQHQRGGGLLPRRRAVPARWSPRRHRGRHRELLRRQRRGHREGVRHHVPSDLERPPRRDHRWQPGVGRLAGQRAGRGRRGHERRQPDRLGLGAQHGHRRHALAHPGHRRGARSGDHGRPHRQRHPGRHRRRPPPGSRSSTAPPAPRWRMSTTAVPPGCGRRAADVSTGSRTRHWSPTIPGA